MKLQNLMKLLTLLVAIFYFNVSMGQDRVFSLDKSFSFIPVEKWKNHSEDGSLIFV